MGKEDFSGKVPRALLEEIAGRKPGSITVFQRTRIDKIDLWLNDLFPRMEAERPRIVTEYDRREKNTEPRRG